MLLPIMLKIKTGYILSECKLIGLQFMFHSNRYAPKKIAYT